MRTSFVISLVLLSYGWVSSAAAVDDSSVPVSSTPVEVDGGYIITDNERPQDEMDVARREIPPVEVRLSSARLRRLPRTVARLADGPALRIVMLGDSIVNDTARSAWHDLVAARNPQCKIARVASIKGSAGCWFFNNPERLERYVIGQKPDLVMIGGISHRYDVKSIAECIKAIQTALPQCEFLLMTGPFDSVDPLSGPNWRNKNRNGKDEQYAFSLRTLAEKYEIEFFDLQYAWGEYIRLSGKPLKFFKRDDVHANARGEAVLGRILEQYFTGLPVDKVQAVAAANPSMGWAFSIPFSDNGSPVEASVKMPTGQDATGNCYVSFGFKGGAADVDPGPGNAIIDSKDVNGNGYGAAAKYDAAGNFQWATPFFPPQAPSSSIGEVTDCRILGVGPMSGDLYARVIIHMTQQFTTLAGTTFTLTPPSGTTYSLVVRLDAKSGRVVWIEGFKSELVHAAILIGQGGICCDASENVFVLGNVDDSGSSTLDYCYGPGGTGIPVTFNRAGYYVMKLDSNGNALWAEQWPVAASGASFTVDSSTIDAAGNVYISGGLSGTNYDIDPSAGTKIVSSAGLSDILVAKLGTDGSLKWHVLNGTVNSETGGTIAVDPAGNVTVTTSGNFTYAKNVRGNFAQFDSSGNRKWVTAIDKSLSGGPWVDADGSLYFSKGGSPNGLIKYSSAGTLRWNDTADFVGQNWNGISVGANYGILGGGSLSGTLPVSLSPSKASAFKVSQPGAFVVKWKQ